MQELMTMATGMQGSVPATNPRTTAERMAEQYGNNTVYCPEWKKWLFFEDGRWSTDENNGITLRVVELADSLDQEGLLLRRPAQRKQAQKLNTRAGVEDMLYFAKALLGRRAEMFDARPWLLNLQNGTTLNLDTGRVYSAYPADYLTKVAGVEYDPEATCPTWESFLLKIFAGDLELIEYVQRAVGYSLTGDTREQCVFILHGTGRNGKSTFLETIGALMAEYGKTVDTGVLMESDRADNAQMAAVAALKGRRFVRASETKEGKALNEALIKSISGGEEIAARFLFGNPFEFKPEFKLWIATNHLPEIRGGDEGIWRRLKKIPFAVTISEQEMDRDLPKKLLAELPGILNWAIRGCEKWRESGLGEPAAVKEASTEYRSEMDRLAPFIEECCELGSGDEYTASKGDVYARYRVWAEASGEFIWTKNRLSRALKDRGIKDDRSNKDRVWVGLRLKGLTEEEAIEQFRK